MTDQPLSTSRTPAAGPLSRGKRIALAMFALVAVYGLAAYVVVPWIWKQYERRRPWLADAPDVTHLKDGHPGDPLNVALIGVWSRKRM